MPGLEEVAVIDAPPFNGPRSFRVSFRIQGRPENFGELGDSSWSVASSDYFHILRIPILRGRSFTDSDNEQSQYVAVINESFARKYFPGEDPLGQQVQAPPGSFAFGRSNSPWFTIVGIAGNVKDDPAEDTETPLVYIPQFQLSNFFGSFLLRALPGYENPAALVESFTREVHTVDSQVPVFAARSMEEIVSRTLSGRRFSMLLLVVFAGLALVLSAVGIYGVMRFFVNQRTHEIGIRIALGAQPRDVLRLVFGFGLTMALAGVRIGLTAALIVTRWLSGLLYGISSTDAITFVAAPPLLSIVALLACYLPARRAMRVDPILALRYE